MQTDQSIDSATATSRRTFLTRTAVGGALVTAGAFALPVSGLVPAAGARPTAPTAQGTLKDAQFVAFAAPLELAAVGAYRAAFDRNILDDEWGDIALDFQTHHQSVADALASMGDETAEAPVADAEFQKTMTDAIDAASDQDGILTALSNLEATLAATHLVGIGRLREKSTAKTVAQVMAVEGQQAAYLAVGGGASVESVTPPTSTRDAAVTIPSDEELIDAGTTTTTTTTTAAASGSDTEQSPTGDAETETSAPTAGN